MITEILNELNLENGSNYKQAVLKKHADNKLLQRVLKMAMDKVAFTYGVTTKNLENFPPVKVDMPLTLEFCLASMEANLCSEDVTGHAALQLVSNLMHNTSPENAAIIAKILDRDLKINMGRTNVNKVIKSLIVKPPYERCDIGTDANIKKNIDFKRRVFSQVKMDGTYRSCINDAGGTTIMSRSGNEDLFPIITEQLKSVQVDGYTLLGEMTLKGEQERSKGNGIINSITEREEKQDQIIFTVWDMLPNSEYAMSKDEIKAATKAGTLSLYGDRLDMLEEVMKDANLENVHVVEYIEITNMKEAYEHFQMVTQRGDEGTVIKTENLVWKDGTSKQQLKVKLVIELEMRFTTYNAGNKGSKNEDYFSGINYQNDEGTIKGTIGVTSMTEAQRDWFHENRETVQDSIFTLTCNDITKGRNNEHHACSHPRYEEIRTDKDATDTLVRALELKEMAMELQ